MAAWMSGGSAGKQLPRLRSSDRPCGQLWTLADAGLDRDTPAVKRSRPTVDVFPALWQVRQVGTPTLRTHGVALAS